MAYSRRSNGSRAYKHDPSDNGIFIHGGTCLMHGPLDPFKHNAAPNRFTITFPLLDGKQAETITPETRNISARTFHGAMKLAKRIRAKHPELHHCPIYSCTDLIMESRSCGRFQVQLVSQRIARRKAASKPILLAAA